MRKNTKSEGSTSRDERRDVVNTGFLFFSKNWRSEFKFPSTVVWQLTLASRAMMFPVA